MILLCICGTYANAQNDMTAEATMQRPDWNNLLSNLNTAQITSGILIDKVVDFSKLQNFNIGTNNISDANHFAQSLSELYRASGNSRFISPAELKNQIATNSYNAIDIGIINTSFQKLYFSPDNPSSAGLTVVNGKFVPIAGRPAFVTKKLFMASPLLAMATGNNITFNFKSNLIFTNAASPIKSLMVDFDNTGNTTIISNGSIVLPSKTVTFTGTMVKVIKFTATFQDNTTTTTFAKLSINYPDNSTNRLAASPCDEDLREQVVFTSALPFQGYTETFPVNGKIQTTVFYHQKNPDGSINTSQKKMLKPIIVVDGFDPKDSRKAQDCDCERDTNPNPKENCREKNTETTVTWNGLFPTVTRAFNKDKHESIEDLMGYADVTIDPLTGLPRKLNLIKELRDKGYDVILVNNITQSFVHPTIPTVTIPLPFGGTQTIQNIVTIDGGADYIERNAMTLVSYMQSIKNTVLANGSSEKLVLIGPSMGGQITRYALAYMEKKFAETGLPIWKHDARLWVSVDSPHLGANVPVGAQAAIWFLGNEMYNGDAAESFNEKLNSVAGKQMIISQFQHAINTATSGTANGGQLNNSPFFTRYYNDLNANGVTGSNGYPVTTSTFRKVAMVNGSLTGKKDATEGATFFKINSYIKANWLGLISPGLGLTALLSGEDIKIPALNLDLKFTGATGQRSTVFRGDGQVFDIGLNHWYIQHPAYSFSVTNNSIRGSLDVVPGGYFKTAKIIREDVEKGLKDAGAEYNTESYIENHSFIPTFSSLAILNPNQSWSNPLNTNLTCPTNRQTPFDSYYGVENNTEHVFFTKDAAEWLYKELAGNPQAPYFPLPANLLTGDNTICENQTKTYSFGDICKIPSPVKYNDQNGTPINGWSISPPNSNLTIISSTPYTVTVKATSNQGADVKIVATFQNGQTYEKPVHVGVPIITNFGITGPSNPNIFTNDTSSFSVSPVAGATNYYWSLVSSPNCGCYTNASGFLICPSGTTLPHITGSGTNATVQWGNCAGGYTVNCWAVNECGSTGIGNFPIQLYKPGSGGGTGGGDLPCEGFNFTVYPNPVKGQTIEVSIAPPPGPCPIILQSYRIARIYDMQGTKVFENKYEGEKSFTITDINLKRGYYILNITFPDGQNHKETIIIE